MNVYYDKSELENDKTYQFIRDLDLPAEPEIERQPPYKQPNTYIKTGESFSTCLFNQQHAKDCDIIGTPSSSQNIQLNPIIYSSNNAGEIQATSQSILGEVRIYQPVDTGNNLATSQHSLCDVRAYNNTVKAIETSKDSQVVSAVWDVIDPHGKVRGLPASAPETPIFCTGLVTSKQDSTLNSVAPNKDSQQRRVIRYAQFVLYSPNKCDITKPEVDRPDGCKTIVISGIPEKMNEKMVNDVFRKCGRIVKIRMRKSNCYITFRSTSAVDNALKLSGYQVVVRDRREGSYCGKLHIDFVPVREEQLQYERAKRKEREAMKEHGPIQPLVPHFSEAAATLVEDQLRNEDSLDLGVKSLIKWMEEGKCNKNNAGSFFSFLQAMQGFVSRLMKDTAKVEEEVRQHQSRLNGKYVANSLHFVTILKAFDIATSQKIWDHFSNTQQSKIDQWKKYLEEIKESNSKDLISSRVEEQMDVRDDERSTFKQQGEELKRLQEENEWLKSELKSVKSKGYGQTDIFVNCGKVVKSEKAVKEINEQFGNHSSSLDVRISSKEAKIIALVGAFLNFHRFGESIDSISKYVTNFDSSFAIEDIQSLLRKFPTIFIESIPEKKWTFL